MRTLKYDVVVIGGGPAGLAAALKAREKVEKVAVLERNDELGGILNQCIQTVFDVTVKSICIWHQFVYTDNLNAFEG